MEMVEFHISDIAAREIPLHLLTRGLRQTHFPKFCFFLYSENQDLGKKSSSWSVPGSVCFQMWVRYEARSCSVYSVSL